jgi:hypothetical protein
MSHTEQRGSMIRPSAPTEIFASPPSCEVFSIDAALVKVPAHRSQAGVLVAEDVQLHCQQRVIKVYELDSTLTYKLAGRASGAWQMARLTGPRPSSLAFQQIYAPPCLPPMPLTMECSNSASAGGPLRKELYLQNAEVSGTAIQLAGSGMTIQVNVVGLFGDLEVRGK